ncbi:MAG: excalibur calcium-binding domain-containing protein [Arcobacter sp.]|uniref:excalibur calcium-binding domain-containing protein n=1 Tax=Arcobacter sp. TaxID=1872629 RepID=UPI003D07ABB7
MALRFRKSVKIFVIITVLLVNLYAAEKKEKKQEFKCQSKKTCKQMSSCKEAIFYLNECGLSKLDRDKDGIPCESICK